MKQVHLVVGITPDLVEKGFDAREIIKEVAKIVGGSGGGRSDFAQGGGNDPTKLDQALEQVHSILKEEQNAIHQRNKRFYY